MWITSCVWQGVLMVLVAGVVAYSSPTLTQGSESPPIQQGAVRARVLGDG
jgi:hypothetical protein